MRRLAPSTSGFIGLRRPPAAALLRGRAVAFSAGLRSWSAAARAGQPAAAVLEARANAALAALAPPDLRLLQRTTLGPSLGDFVRLDEVGYAAYLNEQLNPAGIDDFGLERSLRDNLPTFRMTPAEIYTAENFDGPYELIVAAFYRALYSPRQLFEAACVFWSDHFNIDVFGDSGYFLKIADDFDVVRRHALGTFPALLKASAHSPAMLAYLTNDSNYKDFPQQNYARELMELHTLGADNGYTQRDVEEVARCFTGWFINYDDESPDFGRFYFDSDAHDDGVKTVLGQRIAAGGGVRDGERVLEILAGHPNTSRFIARKLLRFFWGYEPPPRFVERVATVYRNTGGNIRAMLRTILQRRWMQSAPPKLKRPFHFTVSALRALFAGVDDASFSIDSIDRAGHLPFAWSPPNGYPDARGYWSGFLLPRWTFAAGVLEDPGVIVDLAGLGFDPSLTPQALVRRIELWLFAALPGGLSETTRERLRSYLRAGRSPERIREAIGLALSSPEFQEL